MWLFWFVTGAIFGSAAGALAYRLPLKLSWMKGHSRCDTCKHELGVWDLIPVVSYLFLGGKCRYCHSPIGVRNLLIELVTGLAFAVILGHSWSYNGLVLAGIAWVTLVIFVMDWETKLVSEVLVVMWGILVVLSHLSNLGDLSNLVGLMVGVGVVGGLWAVTKGKGMGFGDVEMAIVMGWWLGWPKIGVALWMAFVMGGVVGGIRVIRGISGMKSEIAFGPFLIIGTWIAYGLGDMILRVIGYGF